MCVMGGPWAKHIKIRSTRDALACRTACAMCQRVSRDDCLQMPMIDISSEKRSGAMTRPMTPNACTTRSRTRRGSRCAARAASCDVRRAGEESDAK